MTQERHLFTDAKWQRIEPSMSPCKGRPGGAYGAFFDTLPWIARTGLPWRDLPERLGELARDLPALCVLVKNGHLERIFLDVQQPDMQEVMVDSTCCRAHQSSAGA